MGVELPALMVSVVLRLPLASDPEAGWLTRQVPSASVGFTLQDSVTVPPYPNRGCTVRLIAWAKNGSLVLLKLWMTVTAPGEIGSKEKSWTICASVAELGL